MALQPASKKQEFLRAAIFGPSGSGKTLTSLLIAYGLVGRPTSIAIVDTERGTANKYAFRAPFKKGETYLVEKLKDKTIDGYLKALKECADAGIEVVIFDSLSHAWHELLAENSKVAKAKFQGNTWSAWSESTPKQQRFIDELLSYPGHVIATMRSKTEWVLSEDNGRKKYNKIGLAPEQGKNIEYEFDVLIEMTMEHVGLVTKDRSEKFQDQTVEFPGIDFGQQLAAWLLEGEELTPFEKEEPQRKLAIESLLAYAKETEWNTPTTLGAWLNEHFNAGYTKVQTKAEFVEFLHSLGLERLEEARLKFSLMLKVLNPDGDSSSNGNQTARKMKLEDEQEKAA